MRRPLISIVLPAYNEGDGIQHAVRTIASILAPHDFDHEFVVVDDGSRDATYARAAELVAEGLPVRAIRLSRNFGKEAAILAGLSNAAGDAIVTLDADLQHPPALIPDMVAAWRKGANIVHCVKRDRGDESWWATARARIINAILTRMGGVDVRGSSDFKLLDRIAVDVLTKELPERSRFYRGLAGWVGFDQVTLFFDVAQRQHGASAWSLKSLLALALTALVSFTSVPLRIVSVLGALTFLVGLGVGTDALVSWIRGDAVSGFVTMIMTLLLIGSFVMISLGVIGEYIAKIYDEIKQRPIYLISKIEDHALRDGARVQPQKEPTHA
jgi:polyisoprenyl-phosphate glycosyltransferase